jgi:uncharacterized glyoxalase superfamily protein PhnB
MKVSQYYPVIQVEDVAKVSAFYQTHFGFEPAFKSDWYVHLQMAGNAAVNLAILEAGNQTIPLSERRKKAEGTILNFEVENVDEVHDALAKAGLEFVQPLRDEPFGQRHFITRDPAGVLIDIITPIPPSPEFMAQYSARALPE